VTRKSFALVSIVSLVAAASLFGEPPSAKSPTKRASASRVLTVRDITIFTYQPAPTRAFDARTLRDEGLARLYVDSRGRVTAVKLLRSSGHRDYDKEAIDAFARWRAIPGPAREIDLPLTSVTTGKKAPTRVPLTQGELTIG
jgi:TonB family protein